VKLGEIMFVLLIKRLSHCFCLQSHGVGFGGACGKRSRYCIIMFPSLYCKLATLKHLLY